MLCSHSAYLTVRGGAGNRLPPEWPFGSVPEHLKSEAVKGVLEAIHVISSNSFVPDYDTERLPRCAWPTLLRIRRGRRPCARL
jgi:hypothetical protein